MAQSDNYQQLTVTLLMLLSMVCYLLTRSSLDTTNSVRNFGKKPAYSVHKYRQLRYTREVVVKEEAAEHFPTVDDAVEFTGSKVTDTARTGREKLSQKNLQMNKETLSLNISQLEDSQAIFIEQFLDNIFATENMTHQGIYFFEDMTNASEMIDYNLIEMFLELILMVKIDESLNNTQVASLSAPTPATVLTTQIPITKVNPLKVSKVTIMLRPTPASIILNSISSSTDNSQEKMIQDTSLYKLIPNKASTPSPTISIKSPTSTTSTIVTDLKASPGVNLVQAESSKPGTKSTKSSTPTFQIYKAIPIIPESQFRSLSKPETITSSDRGEDELESRTSETGSSNKNLYPTNTEEKFLKKFVASSSGSIADLYEKTVDLIKELTDNEVPKDLLDFLSNNGKEVINSRGKARIPNFKHKKFIKYYQNLDVKKKSSNLPETGQEKILSALRQQLTASVLGNKRLRQKANNLPAYQPVAKIDRKTFQSYYKSRILKMMKDVSPLPSQIQTKLQQELQESLADQLGNVQAQLQTSKGREVSAKKKLEEELKKSLKKQLREVLPSQ